MASTFTPILRAELQGTGENSGTWGVLNNSNFLNVFESAIAGVANVSMPDSNYTLTTANNAPDEARRAVLNLSGTLTAPRAVIIPNATKTYTVVNGTNQAVTVRTAAGSGVSIPAGATTQVWCNGTNVASSLNYAVSLSCPTISATTITATSITVPTISSTTIGATTGNITTVNATTVSAPTVTMGTSFSLNTTGGKSRLDMAFNDYYAYDPANNYHQFYIAGGEALRVSATDLLYYGRRAQPRAGDIWLWPSVSHPLGTFQCNGQAWSRTTYADLFAVIGTTYGAGDGSTTFNVPNLSPPDPNMRYVIRF